MLKERGQREKKNCLIPSKRNNHNRENLRAKVDEWLPTDGSGNNGRGPAKEYCVSFWSDENILKTDCGDGHITLWKY